jgi:hypothetical protein
MSLSSERLLVARQTVAPSRIPTRLCNLALLVQAILLQRTLCVSVLARAYPPAPHRRVPRPNHDLPHRLKRLERCVTNPRVDPLASQVALAPDLVTKLGCPRWLGLAVDWTMFDTVLPAGRRVRYQGLRLAVARRGRAIPWLQLAYDRDPLPPAHQPEPARTSRDGRSRRRGARG